MRKSFFFFLLVLAILNLSACAPRLQASEPACVLDMEVRVSIDVTNVSPRVVFDQLARELNCTIHVSPLLWKPVTLHIKDATVPGVLGLVVSQIDGKYIQNGNRLSIEPLTIFDRLQARYLEKVNKDMAERARIIQTRLPEGMRFTDVPLSNVLEEISQASGLEFKSWEEEGDRKVTLDLSGMTVEEAIKAVLTEVDGEGAVWIKLSYGTNNYGQYWPWGYPPTGGPSYGSPALFER